MLHQAKEMQIALDDIVLIKVDEKQREICNIGMVDRGKLRTSKSYNEHPIQYLYPLEIHCNVKRQSSSVNTNTSSLDANAKEYQPRRIAAAIDESYQR